MIVGKKNKPVSLPTKADIKKHLKINPRAWRHVKNYGFLFLTLAVVVYYGTALLQMRVINTGVEYETLQGMETEQAQERLVAVTVRLEKYIYWHDEWKHTALGWIIPEIESQE